MGRFTQDPSGKLVQNFGGHMGKIGYALVAAMFPWIRGYSLTNTHTQPFANFLNQINVKDQLSFVSQKSRQVSEDIAKQYYKGTGLSDKRAEQYSQGYGIGRILAWVLKGQMKLPEALGLYEKTMQKSGVFTPIIQGADNNTIRNANQRVKSLFAVPINRTLDFSSITNRSASALTISKMFNSLYKLGKFQSILGNENNFREDNALTEEAEQNVWNILNKYAETSELLLRIFPSVGDPLEAYNIGRKLFKRDPVDIFGPNPGDTIKDLELSIAVNGIDTKETILTLARIGKNAQGSDTVNIATSFFNTIGKVKGSAEKANIKTSDTVKNKVLDTLLDTYEKTSGNAKWLNAAYGYLTEDVGLNTDEVRKDLQKMYSNTNYPEKYIKGYVNEYIRSKTGGQHPQLLNEKNIDLFNKEYGGSIINADFIMKEMKKESSNVVNTDHRINNFLKESKYTMKSSGFSMGRSDKDLENLLGTMSAYTNQFKDKGEKIRQKQRFLDKIAPIAKKYFPDMSIEDTLTYTTAFGDYTSPLRAAKRGAYDIISQKSPTYKDSPARRVIERLQGPDDKKGVGDLLGSFFGQKAKSPYAEILDPSFSENLAKGFKPSYQKYIGGKKSNTRAVLKDKWYDIMSDMQNKLVK